MLKNELVLSAKKSRPPAVLSHPDVVLASQVTLFLQFISLRSQKEACGHVASWGSEKNHQVSISGHLGRTSCYPFVSCCSTARTWRAETSYGLWGPRSQAVSRVKDQASGGSCPRAGVSRQSPRSDLLGKDSRGVGGRQHLLDLTSFLISSYSNI